MAAAVLIAGGAAAGWRRVRPFVEQQAYLRRQRQCMAYVAGPADAVAYEEVPARRQDAAPVGEARIMQTALLTLPRPLGCENLPRLCRQHPRHPYSRPPGLPQA